MKIFIPKNKKVVSKLKQEKIERIEKFEKKIFHLFNEGKIPYPIHLTSGNEKQLLKVFQYIGKDDWVFSAWRNHAHAICHGMSEKKLFKQIVSGKSMYVSCKDTKFFCSSIAGGVIPIALGTAKGIKLKNKKNKVWLFVGDMTSFMGVFYEAYNYSRNFKLPLEIVIEDNFKSVESNTKKVWNFNKINFPKDIFYYSYKLGYPHHGTGKWVDFK